MARPLRPVPPPLEGNDQIITAVITAAWVVALIVLLVLRSSLPAWGPSWIWTCAVGVGLGAFALLYVPRIKRSRAKATARNSASRSADEGSAVAADDGLPRPDA